ncbi:hypothetical protein Hanom_Chr06g00567201 [Helianthus anomalus]
MSIHALDIPSPVCPTHRSKPHFDSCDSSNLVQSIYSSLLEPKLSTLTSFPSSTPKSFSATPFDSINAKSTDSVLSSSSSSTITSGPFSSNAIACTSSVSRQPSLTTSAALTTEDVTAAFCRTSGGHVSSTSHAILSTHTTISPFGKPISPACRQLSLATSAALTTEDVTAAFCRTPGGHCSLTSHTILFTLSTIPPFDKPLSPPE